MADDNASETPDESDLEKFAAVLLRHGVELLVVVGPTEILIVSLP